MHNENHNAVNPYEVTTQQSGIVMKRQKPSTSPWDWTALNWAIPSYALGFTAFLFLLSFGAALFSRMALLVL